MKTILPKNHKYKDYIKGNGIEINDLPCLNYSCFQPHNFSYTLSNGKVVNKWVCRTRENHGCPDHPKKIST